VWVPREHEVLQCADALSKWQDAGDWKLSRTFAEQQVFRVLGTPQLDCLASAGARMCDLYFSEMYDGGCVAVDGYRQHWGRWPARAGPMHGEKPLCWVFPPGGRLYEALTKIGRDQAEAIVVMPRCVSAACEARLRELPVVSTVLLKGPHAAMVQPTSRVPAQHSAGGWKMPMRACRVSWQASAEQGGPRV
jgi:hypothetical protein